MNMAPPMPFPQQPQRRTTFPNPNMYMEQAQPLMQPPFRPPPLNFQGLNPSFIPQYGAQFTGGSPHYNENRPPLLPLPKPTQQQLYPMYVTSLAPPPLPQSSSSLSALFPHATSSESTFDMRMPASLPLTMTSISVDPYESLINSTDRLTLSTNY